MDNKRSCYFCTTPYQILGAISLVKSNKEKADLYIIGQFDNFKDLAQRIREEEIFKEVIEIDEKTSLDSIKEIKNSFIRKIRMSLFYFKIDSFGKKIVKNPRIYNKVYFTSQAFIVRLLHFYFLKNNKDINYIIFDDGIGSYFQNSLFEVSFIDRFLRRIIIGKRALEYNFEKILYMPSLAERKLDKSKESKIKKMPRLNLKSENIKEVNRIFNYKESFNIEEKILILDTLKEEVFGKDGKKVLESLYRLIHEKIGKENIIIKDHPRNNSGNLENFSYYSHNYVPSEIMYINMDMDKTILITSNSTSIVTPKLLFDMEANIILLYELMAPYSANYEKEKSFFKKFLGSYKDKSKVFIPRNIKELEAYLKKIKDNAYEKI